MGNHISAEQGALVAESLSLLKRGAEEVDDSRNAKLVKAKFLDAFNGRDMKTVQKFCAPDSMFCFKGADQGIPLDIFLDSAEAMYASFPDVVMSYNRIAEVQPGVVKVMDVRSRGTHTGTAYKYGPFPAVPTSGILVEETAEWTIHMKNGKMTKFVLDMEEGDLVGPAGYYYKIGGKMN